MAARYNKFLTIIQIIFLLILTGHTDKLIPSKTWEQFEKAKLNGKEPILPDFSFAGYRYGEKAIPKIDGYTINVLDHGANPDDEVDDTEAIQKAIDAASKNKGGIVFFPPGRFLVNTDMQNRESIYIKSSRIVLRGSGSGRGGTIIHMIHPNDPLVPDKMYTAPRLFQIGEMRKDQTLTDVISSAKRETFRVNVDDTSMFTNGMWVTLYLRTTDPKALREFLYPYQADPKWTRLFDPKKGLKVSERHQIKEIEGSSLIFREPIHYNVNNKFNWKIKGYKCIEEIGIEDICFMGNWMGNFVHHRSAYDDTGWAAFEMKHVRNSWIRRCSFINWNDILKMRDSSAISVLQIRIAGNKAHHSLHTRGGYGVLIGLVKGEANHWHGPSLGYLSSGTVFWRYQMHPRQSIDSHSGQPIATLLDRIEGGILYGSGGPMVGFPNHLRYLVLWNFNHQRDEKMVDRYPDPGVYDFWRPHKREQFVKPIIVGFYGRSVGFNKKSLQLLEAQGEKVKPESLYEAQLKLRLGNSPAWIGKYKSEWREMIDSELPEFLDINYLKMDGNYFYFKKKFDIKSMVDYAAGIQLERKNPVPVKVICPDDIGNMTGDENLIRQAIFNMMVYLYAMNRANNKLTVERLKDGDKKWILFKGETGASWPESKMDRHPKSLDLKVAESFCKYGAGEFEIRMDKDTVIYLKFPAE